jgi:hypothetical protein
LNFNYEIFLLDNRSKSQTNSSLSNHDLASIARHSASQKSLSLSAAQRLDNLILGAPNDLSMEGKDDNFMLSHDNDRVSLKINMTSIFLLI